MGGREGGIEEMEGASYLEEVYLGIGGQSLRRSLFGNVSIVGIQSFNIS